MVPNYSGELLNELAIDCVIHLAGIAHDLSNRYKPEDYYRVNFEGTVSIFQEFVKSKATKFIFLSSIKAAVDTSSVAVTEEVEPNPISDYGKSKLKAEEYIQGCQLQAGKCAYIFRPAMIHGKGNKGNLNLLYKYMKSGLPYIFGAYSNQRSFLTDENLHFVLLKFLQNNYPSGIYHVADDGSLSTNELIKIISTSLHRKPRIWNLPTYLLNPISKTAAFFGLPSERLKGKLTENLVVSNAKLKRTLGQALPLDSKTGLMNTLQSFNE